MFSFLFLHVCHIHACASSFCHRRRSIRFQFSDNEINFQLNGKESKEKKIGIDRVRALPIHSYLWATNNEIQFQNYKANQRNVYNNLIVCVPYIWWVESPRKWDRMLKLCARCFDWKVRTSSAMQHTHTIRVNDTKRSAFNAHFRYIENLMTNIRYRRRRRRFESVSHFRFERIAPQLPIRIHSRKAQRIVVSIPIGSTWYNILITLVR